MSGAAEVSRWQHPFAIPSYSEGVVSLGSRAPQELCLPSRHSANGL